MQQSSINRPDKVLLIVLVVSLGLNAALSVVLLGRTPISSPAKSTRPVPAIGKILPPLELKQKDGSRVVVKLDTDARRSLIYVIAPGCIWCARNLANIATALKTTQPIRTILVSLASPNTPDPLLDQLKFSEIYYQPSVATMTAYGLGGTPQSMIIAPTGKLEKLWLGAYTGNTVEDIESFFGVTLPGLIERPAETEPTTKGGNR